MANLVLVARAAQETAYTADHIRLLLRKGIVKGEKQGGIWLVDLDDVKQYEQRMASLGTKKHNPTRS